MSASDFDDHAIVVALEFFVKKLIASFCEIGAAPISEVKSWKEAVAVEIAEIQKFAFDDRAAPEASINALAAISELERIMAEIVHVVERVGVPPR